MGQGSRLCYAEFSVAGILPGSTEKANPVPVIPAYRSPPPAISDCPDDPGTRLHLVDCAVAEIETEVEMDPCAFDFGPEEWSGELGKVGPNREHVVEYVRVELTESPAFYVCRARVRNPDGTVVRWDVRREA